MHKCLLFCEIRSYFVNNYIPFSFICDKYHDLVLKDDASFMAWLFIDSVL